MRFTAIAMGVVLVCGQACFGDWLFQWEGTVEEIKDRRWRRCLVGGGHGGRYRLGIRQL